MSIADEITRIKNGVDDVWDYCEDNGVSVPAGTTIDQSRTFLDQIPHGGEENKFMQSTFLRYIFYGKNIDHEINLDGLKRFSQNNVTNLNYAFYYGGMINGDHNTEISEYISRMFSNATSVSADYCFSNFKPKGDEILLDLTNSNITSANHMFEGVGTATSLSHFSIKIKNDTFINTTDISNMFRNLQKYNKILIDTNDLHFDNSTNISELFTGCQSKFYDYEGNQYTKLNFYLNTTTTGTLSANYVAGFYTDTGITRLDFKGTTNRVYNFNYFVYSNQIISIEGLDLSAMTQGSYFFGNYANSVFGKFGIVNGTTFGNANTTLNLTKIWRASKTATRDGQTIEYWYEDFANNLGQNVSGYTHTITIYTTLYNSLTAEQKALITDKGYTLSSGT